MSGPHRAAIVSTQRGLRQRDGQRLILSRVGTHLRTEGAGRRRHPRPRPQLCSRGLLLVSLLSSARVASSRPMLKHGDSPGREPKESSGCTGSPISRRTGVWAPGRSWVPAPRHGLHRASRGPRGAPSSPLGRASPPHCSVSPASVRPRDPSSPSPPASRSCPHEHEEQRGPGRLHSPPPPPRPGRR